MPRCVAPGIGCVWAAYRCNIRNRLCELLVDVLAGVLGIVFAPLSGSVHGEGEGDHGGAGAIAEVPGRGQGRRLRQDEKPRGEGTGSSLRVVLGVGAGAAFLLLLDVTRVPAVDLGAFGSA